MKGRQELDDQRATWVQVPEQRFSLLVRGGVVPGPSGLPLSAWPSKHMLLVFKRFEMCYHWTIWFWYSPVLSSVNPLNGWIFSDRGQGGKKGECCRKAVRKRKQEHSLWERKIPTFSYFLGGGARRDKEKLTPKSYHQSIVDLVVILITGWRTWEEIFINQTECFQLRRNVKFLSYLGAVRCFQHPTCLKSEEGMPPDLFLFHPLVSFN